MVTIIDLGLHQMARNSSKGLVVILELLRYPFGCCDVVLGMVDHVKLSQRI